MEWYYANERKQQGPVDETEFSELVQSGVIHDATLVWREGMENWQSYGDYKNEALMQALNEVKEAGLQEIHSSRTRSRTQASGESAKGFVTEMPLASVGARALAKLIDIGVSLIVMLLLVGILGLDDLSDEAQFDKLFIAARIFELIYSGFFLGKYGATPGKMAMGLQVVFENGARMTFSRGIQRQAAEWFSALALGIGYLIALFDPGRRTLQDWVCRTLVISQRK